MQMLSPISKSTLTEYKELDAKLRVLGKPTQLIGNISNVIRKFSSLTLSSLYIAIVSTIFIGLCLILPMILEIILNFA